MTGVVVPGSQSIRTTKNDDARSDDRERREHADPSSVVRVPNPSSVRPAERPAAIDRDLLAGDIR